MDEDLIPSFFATFSRFEYALKASGRANAGRNDSAEANWQDAERAIRNNGPSVIAKAGILLTDPPRRQILRDGKLGWEPAGPAGDQAQNLVAAVKRVRNNLFHGGKYSPTGNELSPRSIQLVTCAKAVLNELLQLPDLKDVADCFHRYDPDEG